MSRKVPTSHEDFYFENQKEKMCLWIQDMKDLGTQA